MKKKITNWSNYPVVEANLLPFRYEDELRQLLNSQQEPLITRGNGRCYGDAALGPNILSSLPFNHILSFNEQQGIIHCEAGVMLDELLELIVPKGWFLPVTPGTSFITVGGAVASDVHGKNHHKDGSFSNHIVELELMNGVGEKVRCSREEKADLFAATCGGMGLTGVITKVKFRLKKVESSFINQRSVKAKNIDEIFGLFEQNEGYTYSVAWIDCLQKGKDLGRSVLMLGEHAKREELPNRQQMHPLKVPASKKVSIPFNFPSFTLNPLSVQAFNFAYYNKMLGNEKKDIVSYDPFFYPLDSVLHWNRMYGKKGFVQYQFVLPLEQSRQGLIEILEKINSRKMGSFLAVLKLFGEQESLISFPMRGYTLALDFPIVNGLFEFLDELDDVVMKYGGRIYLTKDARMKPEAFWKGYPNAQKWVDILKKYNPDQKFNSLLAQRLNIIS
ncbi:FAD-binding oxidoreductase [Nafulsella turpanensis]|uniref:FAD-binding oxidoreductase n=1 Tax=Nafulsella turpanensis TaxID=1265690 RepID=UPI00034AB444|nr:FAD-binding oxidoreductase [Nafulsella turpanensis]